MSYFIKFILVMSIVLTGCKTTSKTDSNLNIDAGLYVKADDVEKSYGVIYISINGKGACTATIVSDNTAITASHCLAVKYGNNVTAPQVCVRKDIVNSPYANKCAKTVTMNPAFLAKGIRDYLNDVSVLTFESGTFKHYHAVNADKPNKGNQVVLMGYSTDNPNPYNQGASGFSGGFGSQTPINDPLGAKRWGFTKIIGFENRASGHKDDFENLVSAFSNSVEGVAISPGDSGGPMFDSECRLIGVASRMWGVTYKASLHAQIALNLNFLKSMESQGAYFCGLTGLDSTHCGENLAIPRTTADKNKDGTLVFPCIGEPKSSSNSGNGNSPSTPPSNPSASPTPSSAPPTGIEFKVTATSAAGVIQVNLAAQSQVTSMIICETDSIDACRKATENVRTLEARTVANNRANFTMFVSKEEVSNKVTVIAKQNGTEVTSKVISLDITN